MINPFKTLFCSFFLLIALDAFSSPLMKKISTFLKSGDETAALTLLEQVGKDDPDFLEALEVAQKLFYKRKEWDKFFAYFYFYKVNFAYSGLQEQHNLNPDLLVLEAIALGKLCRWKDAVISIEAQKNWYSEKKKQAPTSLAEAESFILASIKVDGYEMISNETFKEVGPFTKNAYWKLRNNQILKIQYPKNLRMNIKSLCKI